MLFTLTLLLIPRFITHKTSSGEEINKTLDFSCFDSFLLFKNFFNLIGDFFPNGTILSQSRVAGTVVAKYATLTITVSKEPVVVPEEDNETTDDSDNTNSTQENTEGNIQ